MRMYICVKWYVTKLIEMGIITDEMTFNLVPLKLSTYMYSLTYKTLMDYIMHILRV